MQALETLGNLEGSTGYNMYRTNDVHMAKLEIYRTDQTLRQWRVRINGEKKSGRNPRPFNAISEILHQILYIHMYRE